MNNHSQAGGQCPLFSSLTAVTLHKVATSLESGNLGRSSWGTQGLCVHRGSLRNRACICRVGSISRTGSVAVEAGESCRLSGQQAAGPEQSRCCRSSAKVTGCRIPPHSRRPGLQLIGRGPPTLGRAICFTLGPVDMSNKGPRLPVDVRLQHLYPPDSPPPCSMCASV